MALPGHNIMDASLSLMEAQHNEYSILTNQIRARYEEKQAELRRQIMIKTEEMALSLQAIKADYAPASAYVPLDDMSLGEACYKLYQEECAERGKAAAEVSDEVITDVLAVYGWRAIAIHKVAFLRDELRGQELRVWLEDKIPELDAEGKKKMANKFRFYLETMGGAVSTRVLSEVEELAVAAGSHRRARPGRRNVDEAHHPRASMSPSAGQR